jgi:hypothetical protein
MLLPSRCILERAKKKKKKINVIAINPACAGDVIFIYFSLFLGALMEMMRGGVDLSFNNQDILEYFFKKNFDLIFEEIQ